MIKLVKIARIFDNTTPSTSEEFSAYIADIVFLTVQDRKNRTQQLAATLFRVPPQEDSFVSKEYLNKELLRYMLNLELLPEITPSEDPDIP